MGKLDFKDIKAYCDKIGVDCMVIEEGVLITQKKDIWEGVEFALIDGVPENIVYKNGKIVKISRCQEIPMLNPSWAKPSTEQAYVDQLINEAFEKYGEIKEGDRFHTDFDGETFTIDEGEGFRYHKDDTLLFNGWSIYQAGVWATKLPKRIEVEYLKGSNNPHNEKARNHEYKFIVSCQEIHLKENAGEFLAKQLEAYLNGEIE